MKTFEKKLGFTIAELTIAMMLVAAIAMIMMPTLMQNYEKQVFVTSLKKTYTMLEQTNQAVSLLKAQGRIQAGLSPKDSFKAALNATTKLATPANAARYLEEYDIKGVNYFGTGNEQAKLLARQGCLAQGTDSACLTYVNSMCNGAADVDACKADAKLMCGNCAVLKSGTFIFYEAPNTIIVDVNGRKNPNTVGKDVYYFSINDASIYVDNGTTYEMDSNLMEVVPFVGGSCPTSKGTSCSASPDACKGCAKNVLSTNKIDYY